MLKVGIVGVGSMGTQHFLRLMTRINNATVTAVSDINAAHAKDVITPYKNVRFIADPISLINDSEVDAVVIVSADKTHEEFCLEALRLKKFVFCEKPLSASSEGAKKVVDAEIAGGKRLIQLGFNRRFDPAYQELKEIVVTGKIGQPLVAHCAHRNATYPAPSDDVVAITGTAIHEIDTMSWLVGDYFTKAQVIFPKTTKYSQNSNLHDPQIVLLTTSSGMVITAEIWVNCQYAYDIRCEVLCEDGTATLPRHARVNVCTKNSSSIGMTSDGLAFFEDSYNAEFQAWADACNNNTYCAAAASAWDGYCAAVTTDSCLKSQKTGAIESVPLTDRPAFYRD
ncbi:Gfo/Idh/MocA family protein [Caproiciproducens sp. CPB-2]|uniref:Gfo/Idh/MocA family protein n=1 Tax=Caproiciproducens sp. CPB-2 TaxID=3030017 RepID=UPI0023D9B2E8|nr:Gfo/Idh/MocA family oxidoreductase [Caproiciproducens sp. CPB-2]MDF1494958.1 Gfo/Idh/MocA family oxidoreductase [Caproiciproducens sp. CPB-2]